MSGDCQPTREEHKEGRQQGRLEPAGWWKPIRNKTKPELGRAGARPDEGGHVIGPDEGPGESGKPGELGKVERSTGGLPESQGMSKGRGEQRRLGQGRGNEPDERSAKAIRSRTSSDEDMRGVRTQDQDLLSDGKSGRVKDERKEMNKRGLDNDTADNVNYQTKEYNRETVGI
ncbi:hypothetical protein R3P38DRAFT_2761567 [Favolaschia claudopus]|uniref:Uncharacterized protein n=1 Tax=Favolaschia claudopus TaxID=2862362 RepID=A0AAW0DS86_9AGAR